MANQRTYSDLTNKLRRLGNKAYESARLNQDSKEPVEKLVQFLKDIPTIAKNNSKQMNNRFCMEIVNCGVECGWLTPDGTITSQAAQALIRLEKDYPISVAGAKDHLNIIIRSGGLGDKFQELGVPTEPSLYKTAQSNMENAQKMQRLINDETPKPNSPKEISRTKAKQARLEKI